MTSAFYSKAQGIIVCFDVSQKESFLALPAWIRDIRRVRDVYVDNLFIGIMSSLCCVAPLCLVHSCFHIYCAAFFRVSQEAPRECEIIICATKVDLPPAQWEVTEEDFTAYANSMKLNIFTASAQSGNNVEEVFYALARQVLDKQRPDLIEMRESESRETAVVFDNIPKKKKSGCC
jgi:GTPase SAR1 family protein